MFIMIVIIILLLGFGFIFLLGTIADAAPPKVTGEATYEYCLNDCASTHDCLNDCDNFDKDECVEDYDCAECVDNCTKQLREVIEPKEFKEIYERVALGEDSECFINSLL